MGIDLLLTAIEESDSLSEAEKRFLKANIENIAKAFEAKFGRSPSM